MELGAGQGLPGLLAHHLGAAHVTLTDFVPQLVDTLADSGRLAMAQSSRDGEVSGDARGEQGRRMVTAAMLDWKAEARDAEGGVGVAEEDTFEVLLASDVVYAVEHAVRLYTRKSVVTCVMTPLTYSSEITLLRLGDCTQFRMGDSLTFQTPAADEPNDRSWWRRRQRDGWPQHTRRAR